MNQKTKPEQRERADDDHRRLRRSGVADLELRVPRKRDHARVGADGLEREQRALASAQGGRRRHARHRALPQDQIRDQRDDRHERERCALHEWNGLATTLHDELRDRERHDPRRRHLFRQQAEEHEERRRHHAREPMRAIDEERGEDERRREDVGPTCDPRHRLREARVKPPEQDETERDARRHSEPPKKDVEQDDVERVEHDVREVKPEGVRAAHAVVEREAQRRQRPVVTALLLGSGARPKRLVEVAPDRLKRRHARRVEDDVVVVPDERRVERADVDEEHEKRREHGRPPAERRSHRATEGVSA